MKTLSLFILLTLSGFRPPFDCVAAGDHERELSKILPFIESNQFELAIEQLTEFIDAHPKDDDGYYYRGISYEHLEKVRQAISDFKTVVTLNPGHLEAHYILGTLEYHQHNYAEAIDHLTYVMNNKEGYSTKTVLYEYDNFDGGISNMRTLTTVDLPLLNHVAISLAKLKRYEESLKCFDIAIKKTPKSTSLLINRGVVLLSLKDSIGAITDFNTALEISPDQSIAQYNLYLAKGKSGVPLLSLKENNPYAYANRALEKFNKHEFTEAIEDYNKAIIIDPTDSEYYTNRGLVKMKLRQYNGAASDFDKAIRLNHNEIDNLLYAGNAFFHIKKYEKAVSLYNQYLENIDQTIHEIAKVYYNKGLAEYYNGSIKNGCRSLQIALTKEYSAAIKPYSTYCK